MNILSQYYDDDDDDEDEYISRLGKTRKKKVRKTQKSIKDKKFCGHYRCNINNQYFKLEDIFIVGSKNDQFTYGGKTACTTIAIEASLLMLYDNIKLTNVLSWSDKLIDSILKDGCMQDPQRGQLAFSEVLRVTKRFSDRLMMLDEYQDTTKEENAFMFAIKKMVQMGESNNTNVAAIVTKQPETVCIYYRHVYSKGEKNQPKFFIVFDSHPRETDFNLHGAHVLYIKDVKNLQLYLSKWLFPTVKFKRSSLDTLYNSYIFTTICTKPGTSFKPFLVEDSMSEDVGSPLVNKKERKKDVDDNSSYTRTKYDEKESVINLDNKVLKSENQRLKKEVSRLKKELKDMSDKMEEYKARDTDARRKITRLKKIVESIKGNVNAFEKEAEFGYH